MSIDGDGPESKDAVGATEAEGADSGPDTRLSADARLQTGLDHLQSAARDAIAASRAFLDVAEELVDDPRAAGDLVALLSTLAGQATRLVRRAGGSGAAGLSGPHPSGDDDGDPPVERIPVS